MNRILNAALTALTAGRWGTQPCPGACGARIPNARILCPACWNALDHRSRTRIAAAALNAPTTAARWRAVARIAAGAKQPEGGPQQ